MFLRLLRAVAIHALALAAATTTVLWIRSCDRADLLHQSFSRRHNHPAHFTRSFVSHRGHFWFQSHRSIIYDHAGNPQRPPPPRFPFSLSDGPKSALSFHTAPTPAQTIVGEPHPAAKPRWGFRSYRREYTLPSLDPNLPGTEKSILTIKGSPYWPWVIAFAAWPSLALVRWATRAARGDCLSCGARFHAAAQPIRCPICHRSRRSPLGAVARHLLTLLAAASMLVFLIIIALWLASRWTQVRFVIGTRWSVMGHGYVRTLSRDASAGSGGVQFRSNHVVTGKPILPPKKELTWLYLYTDPPGPPSGDTGPHWRQKFDALGFRFARQDYTEIDAHPEVPARQYTTRHVAFAAKLPYWFLAAISAALPLAWARHLHRTARQRRRARLGQCTQCGYDLRMSPHRCPECGTPATASTLPTGSGGPAAAFRDM